MRPPAAVILLFLLKYRCIKTSDLINNVAVENKQLLYIVFGSGGEHPEDSKLELLIVVHNFATISYKADAGVLPALVKSLSRMLQIDLVTGV